MKIFGKDLTQQELGRLMQKVREQKRDQNGKRISRDMIGKAIGVNLHTIYEWERGNKHPSFLNVCKFCDYLDITIDELLGVKKTRYLYLTMSEEERDAIFSMLDECERTSENSPFHDKFHSLKQSIKILFNRAQRK